MARKLRIGKRAGKGSIVGVVQKQMQFSHGKGFGRNTSMMRKGRFTKATKRK